MSLQIDEFLPIRQSLLSDTKDPLYGTCITKFNLVKVSSVFLKTLLPEKLELAQNPFATSEEEHPLLLMFNDVHLRSNIKGLDLNLHYNEFVAMIPFVRFKENSLNTEKNYCYLPVLYLDNFLAVAGGRTFWDFNKNQAHFSVTPQSVIAKTFMVKEPLFSGNFLNIGAERPGNTVDNFNKILPILDLPVIEDRGNDYMICWYKIDHKQAYIKPLESVVENQNCPFLPAGTLHIPSIENDVFGGFIMEYKWSLSYLKPRLIQQDQELLFSLKPEKIAVLGGGLASMAAVFKLTEEADWQSKYDITVYQIGWRLGGKCASGRNQSVGQRIEEHGLHLWFGFYDNAFDMIQKCYKENSLSWRDAFTGHDFICLEEEVNGEWKHWPFSSKQNSQTPGHSIYTITKIEYAHNILNLLKSNHDNYTTLTKAENISLVPGNFFDDGRVHIDEALNKMNDVNFLDFEAELAAYDDKLNLARLDLTDFNLRHFYILANFFTSIIKGMFRDKVMSQGFNVINKYDFKEWLALHGARKITLDSAIVQGVYGLVFGGRDQYSFEAGTALRGLLRLVFTYKGNIYYRMMNGMGDVVFSPFYEVLKKRGVKFNFFNKVTNLALSEDKKNIAAINIDIQANILAGPDSYNPLISVQGSPCWPSVPDYSQLAGNSLEKFDLESYYSQPVPVNSITLKKDEHFSKVILGISIAALPTIARELIDNSSAWKNMTDNIVAIPTVAFQLWLNRSIKDLGWPFDNKGLALVGSYKQPYDTWSDMSQLITKEKWPAGSEPLQVSYFCGPTPDKEAILIINNAKNSNFDPKFPDQQKIVPFTNALEYLNNLSAQIWPNATRLPVPNSSFDFSQLVDVYDGTGIQRLEKQFFRHNIDPTELYVMSLKNSSQYRLKTNENGYENLFITGDWIDNGLNAGCVEATVMSGLQAARAASGVYFDIPWEDDI